MKKVFIYNYSLILILLISVLITKSVAATTPGENTPGSIKLDLVVYEWGSKFIPEYIDPTPKFYTIEVKEGDMFGPANYYLQKKPFELLEIISENKIGVQFNTDFLVVCGEPVNEPSQQNPKIITKEKTCFRTRSHDAGTDIHLKIAVQESEIMPIPDLYQDIQNPPPIIEQLPEGTGNILNLEQAEQLIPPLIPPGSRPEQCPIGCICKDNTATCPTTEAVAVKILTASKPTVVSLQKKSETITNIKIEESVVETSAGITVEENNLYLHTSAGKQKIEILPAEARINIPDDDTIEKIELKEEAQKPAYSILSARKTKLLSLLPVTMQVETKVNARDNTLISVKKPWWSFLVF